MNSNKLSYKMIILCDLSLVDHSYRLIMADSDAGFIDDCRIPLMDEHVDTPASLLNTASANFATAGEGTLIVDRVPLYIFDDSNHAGQLAEFVEQAKTDGWNAGAGAELGSGWITWQKEGRAIVHMGIRSMMPEDPDAMIQAGDEPRAVAERLSRYAKLIGAPYRSTPGVSGLAALRNVWDRPRMVKRNGQPPQEAPRHQPRWQWGSNAKPRPEGLSGTGDMHWLRRPTEAEREIPYVVAYDVRAMYLAAAAGALLGFEAPRNTGAVMFDPNMAGFWRIIVGTGTDAYAWSRPERGVPVVNPNRIAKDGTTWVTTPVLKYLSDSAMPMPEIIDSWLSVASGGDGGAGRYLREWAEQIRDALPDAMTAGDPRLRRHVKFTYVEALALMGTPGGRVSRLDWAWTVRDEARIRLVRKVHKVSRVSGLWPIKIKVDCVYYPSITPDGVDPLSGFGQDPSEPAKIGQFRLDKGACSTMAEFIERERQTIEARRVHRERRS